MSSVPKKAPAAPWQLVEQAIVELPIVTRRRFALMDRTNSSKHLQLRVGRSTKPPSMRALLTCIANFTDYCYAITGRNKASHKYSPPGKDLVICGDWRGFLQRKICMTNRSNLAGFEGGVTVGRRDWRWPRRGALRWNAAVKSWRKTWKKLVRSSVETKQAAPGLWRARHRLIRR